MNNAKHPADIGASKQRFRIRLARLKVGSNLNNLDDRFARVMAVPYLARKAIL